MKLYIETGLILHEIVALVQQTFPLAVQETFLQAVARTASDKGQ